MITLCCTCFTLLWAIRMELQYFVIIGFFHKFSLFHFTVISKFFCLFYFPFFFCFMQVSSWCSMNGVSFPKWLPECFCLYVSDKACSVACLWVSEHAQIRALDTPLVSCRRRNCCLISSSLSLTGLCFKSFKRVVKSLASDSSPGLLCC